MSTLGWFNSTTAVGKVRGLDICFCVYMQPTRGKLTQYWKVPGRLVLLFIDFFGRGLMWGWKGEVEYEFVTVKSYWIYYTWNLRGILWL